MRVKCSLLFPSCVNILTASAKRRRNPRGLYHVKCSFMFCKVSATSPSTSMKWRVKRKPLWGYSLFGLTDLLNKWLAGKMTELHAAGFLLLSGCSLFQRLTLFLTSSVFQSSFFHSYTPSPPTAKEKSGGKVIKVMRRENNAQEDRESCRDEGDENKTNGQECTKGNEAKRKGATERSMITR